MGPSVLVVDNYDSFTFNLVQILGGMGATVEVRRHDAVDIEGVEAMAPDGIVISPGPGRPAGAGISKAVIAAFGERVPVLGVCLGHQCIAEVFGGRVVAAPELMHGRTSWVHHGGAGVLRGLPDPFEATRYHSLVVDPTDVPADLEITARSADGIIMGLRHRRWPIEGVQFHPESILTTHGPELLANFLGALRGGAFPVPAPPALLAPSPQSGIA